MSKYILEMDNGDKVEFSVYDPNTTLEAEIKKFEKHLAESPDSVHSAKKVKSYRLIEA